LADRHSKATKHKLPIEVKNKGFVLAQPVKLEINAQSQQEKAIQLEIVDLRLGDLGDDDAIMKHAK
jgi:hypothetical protein